MYQIIATHEFRWEFFLQVQELETNIVRQQVFRRSLVQSDVEAFQSVGVRVLLCCFEEPDSV
jgi:hypothetical protein